MSNDTFATFYAMKFGPIVDTQAWLLETIWKPFFNAGFGPGYVLTLTLMGIAFGAYLCMRGVFGRVAAALWAAVAMLNPITYGPINAISRDNWFLAFVLLAAGSLVRLSRGDLKHRNIWRAFAVLMMFFACAARQNGVFAVLPLAIGFFWVEAIPTVEFGRPSKAAFMRVAIISAKGTLLAFAIFLSLFAGQRALSIEKTHPEIFLYVYDLAGVTQMTGEMQFSKTSFPAQNMDLINSTTIYGRRGLMFVHPDRIAYPMGDEQYQAIKSDWQEMIRNHPLIYAKYRMLALAHQLGIRGEQIWVYHPQIDANELGMAFVFPELQRKATRYAGVLADEANNGSFIYRAWIYLLGALIAMVVIFRSRFMDSRQKAAQIAHGMTAFTMQIGLLMATLEVEIRYERQPRASAIVLMVIGGALLWKELRDRRQLGKAGPEHQLLTDA